MKSTLPLLNGLGQIRVGQGLEPDLESCPLFNVLPDDLFKFFQGLCPSLVIRLGHDPAGISGRGLGKGGEGLQPYPSPRKRNRPKQRSEERTGFIFIGSPK